MSASLLLVHGAWHGSWAWGPLIEELPDVDVHTVDLPSAGSHPEGLGDLLDDAQTIRSALKEMPGPVVVVAHSYGGLPVTEAVSADSGVVHLVYLCAFQLDVGESLLAAVGGTPPPWNDVQETHIVARTPEEVFYNGVDAELTRQSVARLGVQSRASFEQPLTNAGWRAVPSTYIVCDRDQAIPPFAQEAMAQRAGTVLHLDAGHSPFLSQPREVAGLLRRIVDAGGGS
jgi:pimeloyl-ACP methyl ester carboxylesterase